jgi:hypothetical protein
MTHAVASTTGGTVRELLFFWGWGWRAAVACLFWAYVVYLVVAIFADRLTVWADTGEELAWLLLFFVVLFVPQVARVRRLLRGP